MMVVVVVVMVMVMDQVGALGDCHLYVLQGFWAVRQHMVSGLIVEVFPVGPDAATRIAYDLLHVVAREGEGVLMNL